MKILPETPSLDFLRREAKDLLSTIRESDPEATLAQAQRVLAERYGFTSWTELKAEVERRRAADSAVDPELGSHLASAFGLGVPAGSMSQIAWSQTGELWSLQTDRGRWRLRTLLPWITSESLEDAVRLRDAAVVQGVASPEPVRTPAGDLIVELGVQRWCADAWMDVGPAPVMPPSVALARRVGEILGTLHALALPTSAPINPWLTQRRSAEEWNRIVGVVRSRGADWAPALEDALPAILDLTSIEAEAAGEAPILCICDLSVRAGAGDEVVVVHWDFAGAFLPSCELALVLSGWGTGHDGSVNEPAVKALMDGYRSRAALLPKLDLSSFVADISAWLNWTAGRIGGALNGEDAEWRRREVLELRGLLANPRSRAHYEQILGASDAGG